MTAASRAWLLCCLPLLLTACPPEDDGKPAIVPAQARSALARETSPVVAPGDRSALADGEVSFAFDLYRSLGAEPSSVGKNSFFSPLSLYGALAMTYAGARGDTGTALGQVLHASSLSQPAFHAAFDELDLALGSRGHGQSGADGTPFVLQVTNAPWGQQDLAFEAPFLDTLATSYGAGIDLVDFLGQPEPARAEINGWVEQETEGHITALLAPGSITSQTRLVLVNAVSFNAAWATPFAAGATMIRDFHRLDGHTQQARLMQRGDLGAWYGKGEGWQYLSLPYAGGQVSFDLIVPDAGRFAEIEGALDLAQLQQMRSGLVSMKGQLALPSFAFAGQTLSARGALTRLGLGVAFGPDADFSGISSTPLFLGDVVQQAFVEVNEQGTRATAATAATLPTQALETARFDLTVDRPFVFLVRDLETSTVLFLGRLVAPAAVVTGAD